MDQLLTNSHNINGEGKQNDTSNVLWTFYNNYEESQLLNRQIPNNTATVEPLTNDHPHQRPSLSYDHISCDGQWCLFVYESLTSDHPSYTTTPM